MIHRQLGHVPEHSYTVPFGTARRCVEGEDITLVGISYMVVECMRAQKILSEVGINVEVIDPISLSPLDMETICTSVLKTKRLIVVDCAWTACGASSEIIARVAEKIQSTNPVQLARIGFEPVVCPTTQNLENLFYPDAKKIAKKAYEMIYGNAVNWEPRQDEAPEIIEFRGPF